MMDTEIAVKNFVIDASQERVWRLIGKVIFSSLSGMERVEILDETRFRAFLRVKLSLLTLTMKLRGEIVDILPPDSLAVDMTLEWLRGLFRMNQKVIIHMKSVEQGRTAVACQTTAESMGILFRGMFLRQARQFAQSVFETIEKRLQDLA
jgi:carbon monoxide dehydrogenase subunit G